MRDEEKIPFIEVLHPKLQKKYREFQTKLFLENKKKFEENQDDFINDIRDKISTDKNHRDLINLCIFPFSKIQSDVDLDYNFIRAEPLWELGEKNFDFLLCNFQKELIIFGECKSSINNYTEVVKETEERRVIVENNMDYITQKYLGFKPKYIEYIIGVNASDDENLLKEIMKNNSELIVWSIDRYNKLLSSRTFLNISEEQKRKIEHNFTKLNRKLNQVPTDTGGYDMYPSSHAFTKLRQLILTKENKDNNLIVSPSIIKEKLKSDLFYLDEKYRTNISSKIINYAEQIGFIEPIDENSIEYRIISNYRHEEGLEKDLLRKYINSKVKEKQKEILEHSHKIAQQSIEKDLKNQLTIDKFI
ncbi:MAG: hypothetical protein E4G94_05700 [ANME-2 cluster archaeon]|nr:MAG: hypothetical protein E4G94_05700 [ANME-2 cluster archaeon]